jgi:hypothetical protein
MEKTKESIVAILKNVRNFVANNPDALCGACFVMLIGSLINEYSALNGNTVPIVRGRTPGSTGEAAEV